MLSSGEVDLMGPGGESQHQGEGSVCRGQRGLRKEHRLEWGYGFRAGSWASCGAGGDRGEVGCYGECEWTGGQAGDCPRPAAERKNREGAGPGEKNRLLLGVSWI